LAKFRSIRDGIETKVKEWLSVFNKPDAGSV
jgi:hypothetical protein